MQMTIVMPEERLPTENTEGTEAPESDEDLSSTSFDETGNVSDDGDDGVDAADGHSIDDGNMISEDGTDSDKASLPEDSSSYKEDIGREDIDGDAGAAGGAEDTPVDAEPTDWDASAYHGVEDTAAVGEVSDDSEDPNTEAGYSIGEDDDYVQISLFDDDGEEDATDVTKPEEDVEEEKKYDPEHPRFIDSLFDFVELFIFSLVTLGKGFGREASRGCVYLHAGKTELCRTLYTLCVRFLKAVCYNTDFHFLPHRI